MYNIIHVYPTHTAPYCDAKQNCERVSISEKRKIERFAVLLNHFQHQEVLRLKVTKNKNFCLLNNWRPKPEDRRSENIDFHGGTATRTNKINFISTLLEGDQLTTLKKKEEKNVRANYIT